MKRPAEKTTSKRLENFSPSELQTCAATLGGMVDGSGLRLTFFDQPLRMTPEGVIAVDGPAPSDTVADILLDYLRTGIDADADAAAPAVAGMLTFRELPGAGPLVVAFTNNTHKTLARSFGNDLDGLAKACHRLGGRRVSDSPGFDLAAEFRALPRVPLYLRFNTAEARFPAEASLLFQADAPLYLGLQSLFAVATYFTGRLIGDIS